MLLKVTFTLMIRFIGVTLNYNLIKYGKALIYTPLHESKHQYFGYFHESKNQDIHNPDEAILGKLKQIFNMRDYILNFTLMPWDLGLMLWLDGGQGRL